jgi:hypothetical protein
MHYITRLREDESLNFQRRTGDAQWRFVVMQVEDSQAYKIL